MEISSRDLMTAIHGMGFGALFILGGSGLIWLIYATAVSGTRWQPGPCDSMAVRCYLIGMAVLAWLAVLSGAYVIYPWYRAIPPAGTTDLSLYPQRLLMSNPLTAGWHDYGMEWKEHIAWFAPIAMTMVAYVFIKYGSSLALHRKLRITVLAFAIVAFCAAGIAGTWGAFLNKFAPVRGGSEIVLIKGK
jgi:hypothetical protein